MSVDDSEQLSDPPSEEEEESALEPGPTVQPKIEPVEEIREGMRSKLAVGLAGLLAVIVVAALVTVIVSPSRSAAMNEVLDRIFAPTVGLVGTVVGFYFGQQSVERGGSRQGHKSDGT